MACGGEPAAGPLDGLFRAGQDSFVLVSSYDTTGGNRDRLEIAPGDTAVLLDLDGPGVIRRLWITVASRDPDYLRRIALEMYWDGEAEPSVAVPLGDFFGNGFDKRHYTAFITGVSSGGFYSYLPMPFRRHARIVAVNGTGRVIDAFYYNVGVEQKARLRRDVATLHAWWHRNRRTADSVPHLVLDARGRGNFVGLVLNAESYNNHLWFLEGDERYVVDGTFRGQGTGTEDYFNSGWYFDQGPFAAPFHGLIVKDEERGRIAAYRWHLLDPVPFQHAIRVTLEHGHANEEIADYATTAFWYQVEPHGSLPPLPPPEARRVLGVKIPAGAVLAPQLSVTPAGDSAVVTVSVPHADRYGVTLYVRGAPDGAIQQPVALGDVHAGDSARIVLPRETAAQLAAVHVVPVYRWATDWNVVGPFPNSQILGTETSPAVDSVFPPELDPSLTRSYSGLNGATVRWRLAHADASGRVHLNALFQPNDWVAAYAQAFLYAPDARTITLLFGADDAHVLWVNGERLSSRQGRHISEADDVAVAVRLHRGWNRVLLKVADLDGGWAFLMRAADPDGVLRWDVKGR